MRFNDNARLDTSQVEDRRGSGGGGGGGGGGFGGLSRGGGLAVGGGGLGLVAVVVVVLIMVFSGGSGSSTSSTTGGLLNQLAAGSTAGNANNAQLAQKCTSGASANTDDDCAVVAIINSVQAYWGQQLARSGTPYTKANTVFFTGSTPTGGCGTGQTGMGPFYCPADNKVYIDLQFWEELTTTFGANDAPFTQAYVLAHEYGHHVQNLLGTNRRVGSATGATSGSVRLELQADCYAGVWAKHASTVPGADGQVLITDITQTDLNNALDTAGKIGDDYIQSKVSGQHVDTSSFTHGSSAQRKKWFSAGYTSGNPASCNTFDARNLG